MSATAARQDGKPRYTPQHVANFFLERAKRDGVPMTPLKLIKLVYIAYGWVLALTGERLFGEPIQAWKHGPVIPSLYHEFKEFGGEVITRFATDLDLDRWEITEPSIDPEDTLTVQILEKVWATYKHFRGWDLRQKTHEPGTPWAKAFVPGSKNCVLRDEDIRSHYRERISSYLKAA